MKKWLLILSMCFAGFASCQKDDESFSEIYLFPPAEEDPDVFYVYYRLINRSGRGILCSFNEGTCDVLGDYCAPQTALIYTVRNEFPADERAEPAFGLGGFIGLEFDPQPYDSGIESGPAIYFEDFGVKNSAEPDLGDRSQWAYERLDDLHSRWTYTLTDADYRYALAHPQRPY